MVAKEHEKCHFQYLKSLPTEINTNNLNFLHLCSGSCEFWCDLIGIHTEVCQHSNKYLT